MESNNGLTPLAKAKLTVPYSVCELQGEEDTQQRLAELGFVRGACVAVIQRVGGGAKVRVNGFHLALNRDLLNMIIVRPFVTN